VSVHGAETPGLGANNRLYMMNHNPNLQVSLLGVSILKLLLPVTNVSGYIFIASDIVDIKRWRPEYMFEIRLT
jgi:hypothetical protein